MAKTATAEAVKRVTDPEVSAISKISKLVEGLEAQARARVLSYLHARYCVNGTGNGTGTGNGSGTGA